MMFAMLAMFLLCGPIEAAAQTWAADAVRCEKEEDCLAKLNGRVSREGDRLRLKLDNGKTKTIEGNRAACEGEDVDKCIVYELRAVIPTLKAYVIAYHLYEGGGGAIVSTETGELLNLDTIPEFSPNGEWFVSAGPDYAHGPSMDPYSVTVWSYRPGASKEVFRYLSPQFRFEHWEFDGWEGNDRIKLQVQTETVSDPVPDFAAEIVRTREGWKLNRPN